MAIALLLLVIPDGAPVPAPTAVVVLTSVPTSTINAPQMELFTKTALTAKSDAVEPRADPSFQLVSHTRLTFSAEHPEWYGDGDAGSVSGSSYMARGSVTRSNNV